MESETNLVAATGPQSDSPSPRRLVIRVVIPKGSLQAPAQPRLSRRALLLVLGVVAVLLGWVGVSLFRSDPSPAPAVIASAPVAQSSSAAPLPARTEPAPVVHEPRPQQP